MSHSAATPLGTSPGGIALTVLVKQETSARGKGEHVNKGGGEIRKTGL
jgi:hypothetical protein